MVGICFPPPFARQEGRRLGWRLLQAAAKRYIRFMFHARVTEAPLTLDIVHSTQQELTEAHQDDPEHRFRGLPRRRASCVQAPADRGSWLLVASGSPAQPVLRQSAPTRADSTTVYPAQ